MITLENTQIEQCRHGVLVVGSGKGDELRSTDHTQAGSLREIAAQVQSGMAVDPLKGLSRRPES